MLKKTVNQRRRDNSCIWLKHKVCGTVENFVLINERTYVLFRSFAIGQEFVSYPQSTIVSHSIRVISNLSGILTASPVENFENPCILINNRKIFSKPLVAIVCTREEGD